VSSRLKLRSALDPDAQEDLRVLNGRLAAFYNSAAMAHYFALADSINESWGADLKPHHHLLAAIPNGASVLDVGCGSAPIADHLAGRNVRFTGVDWSSEQIARNAARKPDAEFVAGSLYDVDFGGRQFDVVTNLYVIEHAVWPHRLLDSLYRLAKPGGLIAILTPPFRHGTYLKSFDYGLSAIPFKDKVRQLKWIDAALHAYQHRVVVPGVLRREYPRGTPRGRFLINLDPVGLRPGVAFFPDADAVYLSDTEEMLAWLVDLGAAPVAHWPEWGYVLAKKPA
jgi:ubiquinone/menaquinone biosynthesis C-methylase UbiE